MRLPSIIFLLSALSLASAAPPAVIRESQQALADGLPEVATAKLSRALLNEGGLPAEYLAAAKLQLLEAYVRAGKPDEALALEHEATPETAYWTAQAQARINHFTQALKTLDTIPSDHPRARDATFARADILVVLGETEAALKVLAPLLPDPSAALRTAEILLGSNEPEKAINVLASLDEQTPRTTYLRARATLASNQPAIALTLIGVTPPPDEPPALAGHFALARARALHATGETAAGTEVLLEFVRTFSSHPLAPKALAALEPMGAFDDLDTLTALDGILATAPPERLARTAEFYRILTLANIAESPAENRIALDAVRKFTESTDSPPKNSPEYIRAVVVLVDLENRTGISENERAGAGKFISEPPDVIRRKLADLKARALYRAQRFPEAAESFLASGETGIYNAAIAALLAPGSDGPGLESDFENPVLLLERGLYAAGAGRPDAARDLEKFLLAHPKHSGAYLAHLALAELASLAFPPKPRSAASHLAAARGAAPPDDAEVLQRIDRAEFWASESDGDPTSIIDLGNAFLERWPDSPYRPEIRMKIGESAFRAGNFPLARIQFETLAEKFPESPLAEAALFFAARAALSMTPGGPQNINDAIALWEKVASRNGPLFFHAREQQALTKHSQGLDADAIQILESILAADPPAPPDLRASAQIMLGECLFTLAGEDPSRLATAIGTFDALASDPLAPPRWRENARDHKARALESTGRTDEALELFYDIVRNPIDTSTSSTSRFRAGFEAIRLLEASENWQGAITLAETLAGASGARSAEAAAIAERLKLRHFVYDEKSDL